MVVVTISHEGRESTIIFPTNTNTTSHSVLWLADCWLVIQLWHLIISQHWQVPLSKRFRALKLWFVLRNYGISGLQNMIRENVRLAGKFEALVRSDPRFEIPASRHLGMVVFRLKGDCAMTEKLLKKLNSRFDSCQLRDNSVTTLNCLLIAGRCTLCPAASKVATSSGLPSPVPGLRLRWATFYSLLCTRYKGSL